VALLPPLAITPTTTVRATPRGLIAIIDDDHLYDDMHGLLPLDTTVPLGHAVQYDPSRLARLPEPKRRRIQDAIDTSETLDAIIMFPASKLLATDMPTHQLR
jgi:hypothetical protein